MRKSIVFIVAIVILFSRESYSQNDTAAVKVSKQKVKISGKLFYIHTVKEGETLYGIAKAYQVAQAAVVESNPEIYQGVKIGNTIKIPVVQELANPNPNKDKYHIVKKGETLYSIAKQYNVAVDVLSKVNLIEDSSVRENQQLFIPSDKSGAQTVKSAGKSLIQDAPKQAAASAKKTISHEVGQKETLYSISKKYNTSIESILEANPIVNQEGLKVGQLLNIPVAAGVQPQEVAEPKVVKPAASAVSYSYSVDKPFNIVLMLPLSIAGTTADTSRLNANAKKFDDIMQYYQGTLIAIDSLKKSGVSVNLNVIDTKNDQDPEAISTALKTPALKNADLIIGPVYASAIPMVSKFAESKEIPMVSPLAAVPSEVEGNPYFIQVATDQDAVKELTAEYARHKVNGQTVLVYSADGADAKLVKEFKASVKEKLHELSYHHGGYAAAQRDALKAKLMEGKKNRFIVLSNNEVFVLDFLQNLSVAAKGYDVEVLGTSKWVKFTSVDMLYMHNSNVEIFVPNYVDYNEDGAKSFTRNFRNFYKTEPGNYAFRGFDVAYFFINALKGYGPEFIDRLTEIKKPNIHTPFHFVREGKGGFKNTDAVLIKHTDGFRVVKVD